MTRLLYVYLCLGLWMLFRRVLCVCGDHLSAGGSSGRREAEYASRRASRQRCFFGSTEAARVERGRNLNLGSRRWTVRCAPASEPDSLAGRHAVFRGALHPEEQPSFASRSSVQAAGPSDVQASAYTSYAVSVLAAMAFEVMRSKSAICAFTTVTGSQHCQHTS